MVIITCEQSKENIIYGCVFGVIVSLLIIFCIYSFTSYLNKYYMNVIEHDENKQVNIISFSFKNL